MTRETDRTVIERTRVLLFKEGGLWVAQCLEHDLAVQGKNLAAVEERLRGVTSACQWLQQRSGHDPIKQIAPAHGRFETLYESAKPLSVWRSVLASSAWSREFLPAISRLPGSGPRMNARLTAFELRALLNAKADVETITYRQIGAVLERCASGDIIRLPFSYPDDEMMTASVARSVCNALSIPPTTIGLNSMRRRTRRR